MSSQIVFFLLFVYLSHTYFEFFLTNTCLNFNENLENGKATEIYFSKTVVIYILFSRSNMKTDTDIQGEGGGGGTLESSAYSNPGLTASTVSVNQRYSEAGLNDLMRKWPLPQFSNKKIDTFLNQPKVQLNTKKPYWSKPNTQQKRMSLHILKPTNLTYWSTIHQMSQ